MAQSNKLSKTERREAARKEAERLRKIQAAKEKRSRRILIGVVAAVLALIIAAVVVIALQANRTLLSDFEGATPAGSDLNGGIPIGADGAGSANEGAPELDVYVDFMCPHCGTFEQINGEDLTQAAADGEVTVIYHPVSFLSDYSARAAAAFAEVANSAPENAMDFMNILFANQPTEGGDGLTDEQIAEFAVEAGVPQDVADTLADGTYAEWVDIATQQASRDGASSTPTVLLDGDEWGGNWNNPGELLAAVQEAG
ncbi:DsbA family protein [Ruania zhangjianzhongii]|uniref:DsbA family protein n=1 Tax=Ruania zhangjianzhongii TaxID=2603206 RepID=UPI0011C8EEA5|nr:thioredoxin domain-containing protein [Ruania zhangjianzhongii]